MNQTPVTSNELPKCRGHSHDIISFAERDTAPTIGENRKLLSTDFVGGGCSEKCANYGALNNSRDYRSDGSGLQHLNNSSDEIESQSERQSQMGESVLYHEHVSQYTLEQSQLLMNYISDKIVFFSLLVFVLLPTTMLANGIGSASSDGLDDEIPMVVATGCNINLQTWYIVFTCVSCFKLMLESMRYIYVRQKHQDSVFIQLVGNMILFPLVFTGFFIYTQSLYESSTPTPDHIMSYREAQGVELPSNSCSEADYLSQALFVSFQTMSIVSYFIIFYYLVQTIVLAQSACLIKAIVQRRITMMRRREIQSESPNGEDQQLEGEDQDEDGNMFIEGLFGGLLTIPLPIPEILSSLDKSKFKYKQAQAKKKNKGVKDGGLWKQCPICWSEFGRNDYVTTLVCDEKHIFHTECIEQWIRKGQNSCPLCRCTIANL